MALNKRTPIPVAEAVKKVLEYPPIFRKQHVSLMESDDRILAQDIIATHPVPPFNRSPYDGFAICSNDTIDAGNNPVLLEVVETIGAGQVAKEEVRSGKAIRIMTGAQLPVGADAVIMLELTEEIEKDHKSWIKIKRTIRQFDNISFEGEDTKEGEILVRSGEKITPGAVAVLATFGYSEIDVYKKPVVGILATGTELLDVHEPLSPGKIRNSNAYMVAAQVKAMGAEPIIYGSLADDFDALYEKIKDAFEETDILITTGGVSVGDYDYLPEIYKKMQAEVLFNKIAMRPGSVTSAARINGKLLFGLSGNPSACFVGCELFVRPYINLGFHRKNKHLAVVPSKLGADFPKPNPFTRFVRCTLTEKNGEAVALPSGLDKSSSVTSLLHANGLLVLPGGTRGWEKGSTVGVLSLEREGSEWPWENPLLYK